MSFAPDIAPTCIGLLILEELEDDDYFYSKYLRRRAPIAKLFNRDEGAYEILVKRHFRGNNVKFIRYFRVSIEQFDIIVDLVKEEITKKPNNRHALPISSAEKVAIVLR